MDPFILGKLCNKKVCGKRLGETSITRLYEYLSDGCNQVILAVIKCPTKVSQYERLLYGRTAFKNNQVRFLIGYFLTLENLPSMRRDAAWEILIQGMLRRAYSERFNAATMN